MTALRFGGTKGAAEAHMLASSFVVIPEIGPIRVAGVDRSMVCRVHLELQWVD